MEFNRKCCEDINRTCDITCSAFGWYEGEYSCMKTRTRIYMEEPKKGLRRLQ